MTSAVLYRKQTPQHTCQHGLRAKALLLRRGISVEEHLLTSNEAAAALQQERGVSSTPFIVLNGEVVGGYDDLAVALSEPQAWPYQPIAVVFAMALAIAVAVNASQAVSTWGTLLMTFGGVAMCILALLKLQDLRGFTAQFLGYDLLAQQWLGYATLYPLLEGFAGLGMLSGWLQPLPALTALTIGTIGAASVVKAVYLERRSLRCACVGGNSGVPLGAVSLVENLLMMAMGGWVVLSSLS